LRQQTPFTTFNFLQWFVAKLHVTLLSNPWLVVSFLVLELNNHKSMKDQIQNKVLFSK